MPPKGSTAWLTADDALTLMKSGTPSKLGQELSRGVDPNQALEIPSLDIHNQPRGSVLKSWPPVAEADRESSAAHRDRLLPPAHGSHRAAAEAALDANWYWDPSWDDCVPLPPQPSSKAPPAPSAARGGTPLTGDARWPLLLVACHMGNSPLMLERLLKAGADPNAVHQRSGTTALMCLAANENIGPAGKKEAIQMLAKFGFRLWGAVRRDSFQDAVLSVLLQIFNEQAVARREMAAMRPAPTPAQGGPKGPKGSAAATRGGGGAGGGGGNHGLAAAILERCQRRVAECFELLEELLRRRCWPPARGCPNIVAAGLGQQLALLLLMMDVSAPRVLEMMTAHGGGPTGLGPNTMSMRKMMSFMLSSTELRLTDSRGQIPLMSRPVVVRRLTAAGVRPEELVDLEGQRHELSEPGSPMDPAVLAAALAAGAPSDMVPSYTAAPMWSPPWSSLLGELVAEEHPAEALDALLRAGADPRAPVLGCVRPLTLAFMAGNRTALEALRRAGAPESDGPPGCCSWPPQPELPLAALHARLRELMERQPLRGAGEGLLRAHMSWLVQLLPAEVLKLMPLLSSPSASNALTLLALLRCSNSRLLREELAQWRQRRRQVAQLAQQGLCPVGPLPNPPHALDVGAHATLVTDYILENPASPYIPYVFMTFPFVLAFTLSKPRIAPLLVAPIKALADRVDPSAARSLGPATATATATATASHGGVSSCPAPSSSSSSSSQVASCTPTSASVTSSSGGDGTGTCSNVQEGTDPTGSGVTSTASAAAASGSAPAPSPRLPPVRLPEWPPEQEVPYEVLGCVLRLPWAISRLPRDRLQGDPPQDIVRCLWDSGYAHAALRIASAVLRTEHLAATAAGAGTGAVGAPAGAASPPSSPSSGASPASALRWRLLESIFTRTLPGLGLDVEEDDGGDDDDDNGRKKLPPLTWLPTALLLMYHDPWVRALVANGVIDAIAQAAHAAAAEAAGAASKEEPEERLAAAVEAAAYHAANSMSFDFSSPETAALRDAWVSERVAATLAARRAAAAAPVAVGMSGAASAAAAPQSAPSGGGSGSGGVGKKAAKKAAAAASAANGGGRPALTEALSYEPYGSCLTVVPCWVQTAVANRTWAVLGLLRAEVAEAGGGRRLAGALLDARSKLGPPLT